MSPFIKFKFLIHKGSLHHLQKNNQAMKGLAIPDNLNNFRCGKHVHLAHFLSRDVLIYIVLRYSQGSVIQNSATDVRKISKTNYAVGAAL